MNRNHEGLHDRSGRRSVLRCRHALLVLAWALAAGVLVGGQGAEAAPKPKPGTVQVQKALVPVSDSGRFDLLVGGTVVKAAAGDGGAGSVALVAGTYRVSEAATNVPLDRYSRSVSCTKNGAAYVANASDSAVDVDIRSGDAVVCTISNRRLAELVETETTVSAQLGTPLPQCNGNFTTCQSGVFRASVTAANGASVNEGSVSFYNEGSNHRLCTADVENGMAGCSGSDRYLILKVRGVYSGSATYASSTGFYPA